MKHQLPKLIQNAITTNGFVIFAGSGLSMLPPSNLPSWWGYNQAILEEAKQRTLNNIPNLTAEMIDAITDLSLDNLDVAGFSEQISALITEKNYLPLLSLLESKHCNANHLALAELARKGVLRAIVTTNFDTLIERAFRESGVPLNVYTKEDDYTDSINLQVCTLYKVHGTVTTAQTMKDTVTQKLRGLSYPIKKHLQTLFTHFPVLVTGFSGADLKFNPDYFSFMTISNSAPGIVWTIRSAEQDRGVSKYIQQIIDHAGSRGEIWWADLPDLFEQFNIPINHSRMKTASTIDQNALTEKRVKRFYDEMPLKGLYVSTLLCVELLDITGKLHVSRHLLEILSHNPDVTVMRRMGILEFQAGNWDAAISWYKKELKEFSKLTITSKSANGEVQTQNISDDYYGHQKARCWINIAAVYRSAKKFDEAENALLQAKQFAEKLKDNIIWAHYHEVQSLLARDTNQHPDTILALFETTRQLGSQIGRGMFIYESQMMTAQLLNELCEYDMAEVILERAKLLSSLIRGERSRVTETKLRVEILISKNKSEEARDLIFKARNRAEQRGADLSLLYLYDWLYCQQCSGDKLLEDDIIQKLDEIINIMNTNADLKNFLDKAEVMDWREKIPSIKTNGALNAVYSIPQNINEHELKLRQSLAVYEFEGNTEKILWVFHELCQIKFKEQNIFRLHTLAEGYEIMARRVRARDHIAYALNWKAIIFEAQGRIHEAIEAYRQTLELGEYIKTQEKAILQVNYRRLLQTLGQIPPTPTKNADAKVDLSIKSAPTETFDAVLLQISRLKQAGKIDDSLELLKTLTPTTHLEEGKWHGTRANIHQTANEHEQAIEEYTKASECFKQLDQHEMLTNAKINTSVSHRHLGNYDKAVEILRALLTKNIVNEERIRVLMSLANTLYSQVDMVDESEQVGFETILDELKQIYEQAWEIFGGGDERRGILTLNNAQVYILETDFKKALELLQSAKVCFIRSNSQYLETCEHSIAQIEEIIQNQ